MMNDDWKYRRAQKQVKKQKDFYQHLAVYLTMSVFFVLLNIFTGLGHFWAIYPIMGWGIGIASHAFSVFGFPGKDQEWERRKLEEEMARMDYEEEMERSRSLEEPSSPEDLMPDELELDPDKELRKRPETRDREWPDSDFV